MLVEAGPLAGVEAPSVTARDLSVDAVEQALGHDDPLVRQHACECCLTLAGDDAESVVRFASALLDALDDESVVVAQRAAAALLPVAAAHPDAFDGGAHALARLFERDVSIATLYGAKLLAAVVIDRPDVVAPAVGALVRALDDTTTGGDIETPDGLDEQAATTVRRHQAEDRQRVQVARETVANVVAAVAEDAPESIVQAVPDIVPGLDDSSDPVVAALVDALAWVAAEHPDAVRPHRDALVDRLDHEDRVVRARTIRALGLLGDASAADPVATIATTDPDEDVRELAAETASLLRSA